MSADVDALRLDRAELGRRRQLPFWTAGVVLVAALAGWWLWPMRGGSGNGAEAATNSSAAPDGAGAGTGRAVRTVRVPAPGASGEVVAGGWIEPAPPAPLVVSARVAGTLAWCELLPGDTVAKGAVVARLDPAPFDLAVRRASAELELAKRRLATLEAGSRPEHVAEAQASLAEAEAARSHAAIVVERLTPLAAGGGVARARLEQAQAGLEAAVARRDAAQAGLELRRAGTRPEVVAEARAAVALAAAPLARAEQERAWSELRAPAAGVVYERFVQVGEVVDPARAVDGHSAGAVLTLYDPAQLQVRVDLTQDDAAQVKLGDGAVVSLAAAPGRTFAARVARVDPRGDLAKNTVRVRVRLETTGPGMHPDLTARVAFQPAAAGGAAMIRIPARCVVSEGARARVWTVRDGSAHPVEVTLGDAAGREVVVSAGLRGGETLILDPPADLVAGAAVNAGGGAR